MSGYTCPFCQQIMSINYDTTRTRRPNFSYIDLNSTHSTYSPSKETVDITFHKCPNCNKISIVLKGVGSDTEDIFIPVYPQSLAKQFPSYIPLQLRQDYEEAYAIANLSPKASATLSRRCLQGMIRDFWGITDNKLADAIKKLETRIPASQWKAIDSIRKLGNIGAHMEKDINLIVDIEPDEATILLKLIELLMEKWYINRSEEEQLCAEIISISDAKQEQRGKN